MGELIAEIEEVVHVESESEPNKRAPKGKSNLGRISEGNEEELMRESDEKPAKDKKSRKRLPQQDSEDEPSNSGQNKPIGPARVTRSNRARIWSSTLYIFTNMNPFLCFIWYEIYDGWS